MRARDVTTPLDPPDRAAWVPWSTRRTFAAVALVAVGYYVGVQVGLAFTFRPEPVSVLWPSNAILLAALLVAPTRVWGVLLLAALPSHLIAELHGGVPLRMVLSWYLSNCFEAWIGAYFVRRFTPGPLRLDTLRGLQLFIGFSTFLAPFLSSFLDAGLVALNGWGGAGYWTVWQTRFLSNMLAVQLLVPVIVETGSDKLHAARRLSARRRIEIASLSLCVLAVCFIAFLEPETQLHIGPAKAFIPLPFLFWAAVRFGTYGVTLSLASVTFASIWGAIHGNGPFIGLSPLDNARSVQLFLVLSALPLSVVTALMAERVRAIAQLQTSRDAERAQREDDERMALAAASANIGFWSYEIASRRLWVTEQYRSIFGLPPDVALTAATSVAMIHTDNRESATRAFADATRTGAPLETEFRVVRPDGIIRNLAIFGRAQHGDEGAVVRLTGVVIDTTERRTAERDAVERRREVAHLSRVAAVGELSGALAHELAQPLAAIMSNAQVAGRLLQREPLDLPLLREIITDIVNDDRRGANVIRHVRGLLRKEDSPRELLDMRDLVREVLALQRSDLMGHEVEVISQIADRPAMVTGDRVQLEQVLLNLMMNARDAMDAVTPWLRRLRVSVDLTSEGVRIKVGDSGLGIPQANLQHVFDSFYTTKPRGLGLGLPICRAIVDDHDGRIWAECDGAGATLIFVLPNAAPVPRERDATLPAASSLQPSAAATT